MKLLFILLLFILALYQTNAQDHISELVTDRPDQTESSTVIPAKSLQIETGFVTESMETDLFRYKGYAYNTTLLRYGLLDNMELRLGLEYTGEEMKIKNNDSLSTTKGFGPLYTGFKLQITREKGLLPEIAFLAALVLPFTAGRELRTAHTAVNMRMSVSHTLSDLFSLGYNLGVEWDGESAVPTYYYSAVLGFGITKKLGVYAESFGFLPEKGKATHLLDAGLTYLLSPNLQLDMSWGLGLNEEAVDNFLSCGFSCRLPR